MTYNMFGGTLSLTQSINTSCTVSTIRMILVPFHGILYCYDIPRYIVTLEILVFPRRYRW